MEIKIKVRSVYGVNKVYPICEKAQLFAKIAGTTTLTVPTLKSILDLDYHIQEINGADWINAITIAL